MIVEEDLEDDLELTCDDSYFKYCKYKSDHVAKWKSDFDKDGDRILYENIEEYPLEGK